MRLTSMDAYLVIGNAHTRKASLVRSLSGCFNRSVRDIQLLSTSAPLRVYARVGSLQDTKTRPEDLAAEADKARCAAVLCCLSPSAHPNHPAQYPDAQAYVAWFKAAGWRVRGIAVLGQNSGGVRSPQMRQFPQAPTAPINVTAQAVRLHFGWA
jgi:hypothetical protein